MKLDDPVAADLAAVIRAAADDPGTAAFHADGLRLVADRIDPGTITPRRSLPWGGLLVAISIASALGLALMIPIGILWHALVGRAATPFIAAISVALAIFTLAAGIGATCVSDYEDFKAKGTR